MLNIPTFLINLDRCPERLATATKRMKDAGFQQITRFSAIDGQDAKQLKEAWEKFGIRKMHDDLAKSNGAQACLLSHLAIWERVIKERISMANIFEDDQLFHALWNGLRSTYLSVTPAGFDILYYGSTFFQLRPEMLVSLPAHGTGAYCITRRGAQVLLDYYKKAPEMHTVDGMLLYLEMSRPRFFTWYNWNLANDDEWNMRRHADGHPRCYGLVKQDPNIESTIR